MPALRAGSSTPHHAQHGEAEGACCSVSSTVEYFFEQIRQALTKGARKHRTSVSWCNAMQEFVRQQNIAEFRKLLAKSTDKYQRRTLLQLLAEEEEKAPHLLKMKARDSND